MRHRSALEIQLSSIGEGGGGIEGIKIQATEINRVIFKINRPFAASDHVVQNQPCWRASSLLFSHWDIKTKRPEPVRLDLLLF